jgi:hypothetical protein
MVPMPVPLPVTLPLLASLDGLSLITGDAQNPCFAVASLSSKALCSSVDCTVMGIVTSPFPSCSDDEPAIAASLMLLIVLFAGLPLPRFFGVSGNPSVFCMLCCVVLCCAMLWCTMLFYIALSFFRRGCWFSFGFDFDFDFQSLFQNSFFAVA